MLRSYMTLPAGTYLRVTGTQEVNDLTVTCGSATVNATEYGTCTFTVTSGSQDHSGGGN